MAASNREPRRVPLVRFKVLHRLIDVRVVEMQTGVDRVGVSRALVDRRRIFSIFSGCGGGDDDDGVGDLAADPTTVKPRARSVSAESPAVPNRSDRSHTSSRRAVASELLLVRTYRIVCVRGQVWDSMTRRYRDRQCALLSARTATTTVPTHARTGSTSDCACTVVFRRSCSRSTHVSPSGVAGRFSSHDIFRLLSDAPLGFFPVTAMRRQGVRRVSMCAFAPDKLFFFGWFVVGMESAPRLVDDTLKRKNFSIADKELQIET